MLATAADCLLISNILHFVFCIITVIYMLVSLADKINSSQHYEFRRMLNIVLIYLSADMLSYVFDMQSFPGARFGNHVSMFFSVSLTALIGFFCNRFFDLLFPIGKKGLGRDLIYLSPTILLVILLIVNIFTGWLYVIGEDNVYTRGILYPVSFTLQYLPYAIVLFRAIFYRFDVITMRRRQVKTNVIWFSSIALFFGVVQAATLGKISMHCFGITAGLLIIYLGFQERQITNDILTGLRNRQALDKYVADKTKVYSDGTNGQKSMYFLLMDVNDFKSVNDLYGHLEGDRALREVSDSLKEVGYKHSINLFLSRYGGDEFAAVFETEDESGVIELCEDIRKSLYERSLVNEYPLSIAIGYSRYTGQDMSIDELYRIADTALYKDKARIKQYITN